MVYIYEGFNGEYNNIVDFKDSEHMRVETKLMQLNDNIQYYIGLIMVVISIPVLGMNANLYFKKRLKIRRLNKYTSKWKDLKNKDLARTNNRMNLNNRRLSGELIEDTC